jgi:hypothetical protein
VLAGFADAQDYGFYQAGYRSDGFHLLICTICGYSSLYVKDMQRFTRQREEAPEAILQMRN